MQVRTGARFPAGRRVSAAELPRAYASRAQGGLQELDRALKQRLKELTAIQTTDVLLDLKVKVRARSRACTCARCASRANVG